MRRLGTVLLLLVIWGLEALGAALLAGVVFLKVVGR